MKTRPTFAFVLVFLSILWMPTVFAQNSATQIKSPEEVLREFFNSQVSGAVLAPGGWEKASELLLRREPLAQQKEIVVVSHYLVSRDSEKRAENPNQASIIYFGFYQSGIIRPDLSWEPANPRIYPKVINGYHLILGKNYWQSLSGSDTEKELTGPLRWRIDYGSHPISVLYLTRATAIRYVVRMRDRSKDPVVKNNANQTLAALAKLRY